ncbi:Trehalase [Gryllus bimaculatus]|nr:Trehalase [Gryllus bimaculatus]
MEPDSSPRSCDFYLFSFFCCSEIYCHGDLLHYVQLGSGIRDSKEFVDMKMKYGPSRTLEIFNEMMNETQGKPNKQDILNFLAKAFEEPGSEFEFWDPVDWIPNPKFLNKIQDPDFRRFAEHLNSLWKSLGRKMKDAVKQSPEFYSIIYVPHPVIVPGGRFREFYYWDSFWIIRGLLLSEMQSTVKGMLENFLSIVERFGFIPNGGRIYYAMRSQPPFLIPMVQTYVDTTQDYEFIEKNIDTLDKEFQHWMVNHTVNIKKDGKVYTLARYKDNSNGPRPESYKEDYESAHFFHTEEDKENYYSELKAAAESGWDFSSRWFVLNGTNKGNLTNLKVRSIIPVELNAVLYGNAKTLANYYSRFKDFNKSEMYNDIAEKLKEAVTAVLWHKEVGAWLDYDMINDKRRDYFYPTNISPLWTGCYDTTHKEQYVGRVLKYLEHSRATVLLGGIPTTMELSNEQWDYPNAWAPLQHLFVESLDATGDPWAKELAYQIAQKWVRSNFKAWNETGNMYEKYDATKLGGHGEGGEYRVQLGFGWSNGVVMDFLDKYGHNITLRDKFEVVQTSSVATILSATKESQILTAIYALLATLAAGSIGLFVYKKRSQSTPMSNTRRALCPKFCGGYMELKDLNFD